MNRREYIAECSRLSGQVSVKLKAVRALLAEDPDLEKDGAYDEYWKLQNEATTASIAWTNYCAENKHKVQP